MVDVGSKSPTRRSTTATVHLGSTAFLLLRDNQLAKGDAHHGRQADKTFIPLCNLLPLDQYSVAFDATRPLLRRPPLSQTVPAWRWRR
ncbi:unnamed protein product [Coregonus sp. 'balchen']|nr:unnamed protein product [Coregonus sp. 'balchen']